MAHVSLIEVDDLLKRGWNFCYCSHLKYIFRFHFFFIFSSLTITLWKAQALSSYIITAIWFHEILKQKSRIKLSNLWASKFSFCSKLKRSVIFDVYVLDFFFNFFFSINFQPEACWEEKFLKIVRSIFFFFLTVRFPGLVICSNQL